MKLAFFSNSYLPYLSGITISIKTLREELQGLGHTAFVVGPKYPGHQEAEPNVFRLPSIPAPYPGYRLVWPYSYPIFKQLKSARLDLIHAHQPFGVGLASLVLARRLKIPFVYSFHTLFSRYLHNVPLVPQQLVKGLLTRYLTWFCNQADQVIAPSEMVRRLLVSRKVKTAIAVIPTGINLDKRGHSFDLKKRHNLSPNSKILLYSGRLSAEKNVPFLLKAFPKIKKHLPNTYFIVVGGGPKKEEYQNLAQQLDDHIVFTGQISQAEVPRYYLAADLFVYASRTETQGLVITEAKAGGLPVVAVFGGGLADVINSGTDGYLVPENQAKFVDHVVRLLQNDPLRKDMSLKAQADARQRFSSLVVAKQMETVYNSLINK